MSGFEVKFRYKDLYRLSILLRLLYISASLAKHLEIGLKRFESNIAASNIAI
jgi:hypothetical protein